MICNFLNDHTESESHKKHAVIVCLEAALGSHYSAMLRRREMALIFQISHSNNPFDACKLCFSVISQSLILLRL